MAYAEDDQDNTEDVPKRPASHAGPMDDEEFQYHVKAMLTDAELFVDRELSPYRAEATDYYNGEPLGTEEDGRSQVVVTEVADAISGAMPSLMRMFFGPHRVVEYVPRKPEDVEPAKQATDYACYVMTEENPGFMVTHDVFKDGLLNLPRSEERGLIEARSCRCSRIGPHRSGHMLRPSSSAASRCPA